MEKHMSEILCEKILSRESGKSHKLSSLSRGFFILSVIEKSNQISSKKGKKTTVPKEKHNLNPHDSWTELNLNHTVVFSDYSSESFPMVRECERKAFLRSDGLMAEDTFKNIGFCSIKLPRGARNSAQVSPSILSGSPTIPRATLQEIDDSVRVSFYPPPPPYLIPLHQKKKKEQCSVPTWARAWHVRSWIRDTNYYDF